MSSVTRVDIAGVPPEAPTDTVREHVVRRFGVMSWPPAMRHPGEDLHVILPREMGVTREVNDTRVALFTDV